MIRFRSLRDFFAGLMFVAFGGAAVWLAQAYPFGNAGRMGPAYFPTLVGSLLIILGAFVVVRGLAVHGQKPGSFHFRPLILVLAGIVLFGFTLERLGLMIAIFTLVVFSSLGGSEFRYRGVLFLAAVLALGSFLVFIYGLGLQIPAWPFSY
ncbi:MAG: tripartite tricarboxylate transporter TctB family protein [Deltaproteobacteria bacterium]|nr:tripartite tricarboxylate transporter TctB family protein [Deltaproteobacteria bacterium]